MTAKRRRWPARLAAVAAGFGMTALGVTGAALWFVTTEAGSRSLLGILGTRTVQSQLLREGHVEAGRLSTDWLGHLVLEDVVLRDGTGRAVIAADRLTLRYDGWAFLKSGGARLHVAEASIVGLSVDLATDAEGRLDLARMFGSDNAAPSAPSAPFELPFAVDVDKVAVVGGRFALAGGPQVEGVSLFAGVHGAGKRLEVADLAAQGVLTAPFLFPVVMRGGLAYTGDAVELSAIRALVGQSELGAQGQVGLGEVSLVKLGVDLGRLHLADIEHFSGPLMLKGDATGHIDAVGPLALLGVHAQLALEAPSRGKASLTAIVAATSPGTPWWASLQTDTLHVEDVVGTVPVVVALDGRLDAAGRGAAFPGDLVVEGRFVGDVQQVDTLALEHLDAPLRLEGGVLRWTDADARSALGPLRVDGELNLVDGALATDVRGPLQLGGLAMFGLEGTGGGGTSLIRVTGNVFAEELPLDATMTIAWAPLIYGDDVRFERADGVVRWSMRAGVQHADGELVLRGGHVYGATIARLALPDLDVALPADGTIALGGTADAVAVAYGDIGQLETASGAWSAVLPPNGDPVVHAELAVGPVVVEGFPASGGAVAVDFAAGVVRADLRLVDGDRDFLVVAPTLDVASGRLTAPSLFVSPTHRQAWVSDGPVAATVTAGGVTDAHLALTSDLGRVVVWGDFDTDAPLMGHVEAEGLELDVFAELFPEQAGDLAGKLTLVADVAGTSDAPVFDATVDVTGLFVPGVSRWLDVAGTLAGDATGVSVRADVGVAGAPLGQITGRIPAHLDLSNPRPDLDGPLDVVIDVVRGPMARLGDVYADAPALPQGDASAHLAASGTLRDPVFEAALDLSLAVSGWAEPAVLAVALTRQGQVLTLGVDLDEGEAPRLVIAGTARTRIGEWIAYGLGEGPAPDATDAGLLADAMALRVDAPSWPLKSLLAVQGYDPGLVTGDLTAGFDVTGTFTQPVFDGRIDVKEATLVDVPIEDAALVLKPGRAGYGLDASVGLDGDTLSVRGRVPVSVDVTKDFEAWFDDDLDLVVDGSIPLALVHVADPRFRGQGRMSLQGRITGRPTDPWPDLEARIDKGGVSSASLGVDVHEIALDAHLDPTRLHLRSFAAGSSPVQDALGRVLNPTEGRLEGALDLGLAAWSPTTVDGWLALDRTWLASSPTLTARMSGRIDAVGDGVGPISVVGSLAVDEAHYVYDADASITRPIVLDPRITVHRPGDVARGPRAVELGTVSMLDNVQVDVAIELARAVEVEGTLVTVGDYGVVGAGLSRADFDVRIDSRDLRLEVDRGELGLAGEVEIVEGDLLVLGRPFTIGASHAAFLGDPYEPQLIVNASTDVQGASIDLAVTGTPSRPKMDLSSEDFANDPTSMITALVTGQRPENLGAGAAANALLGLGLSNVIGALGGKLGNLAQIQADGTVHVVTRLGPRVRLEGIVDPLPSTNQNAYGAQIEITPFPHVLFKGVYGDEQQWMDLYWETRF